VPKRSALGRGRICRRVGVFLYGPATKIPSDDRFLNHRNGTTSRTMLPKKALTVRTVTSGEQVAGSRTRVRRIIRDVPVGSAGLCDTYPITAHMVLARPSAQRGTMVIQLKKRGDATLTAGTFISSNIRSPQQSHLEEVRCSRRMESLLERTKRRFGAADRYVNAILKKEGLALASDES